MGSFTSVAGCLLTPLFFNYLFQEQYIYFVGGYWGMNKRVSRLFHNPLWANPTPHPCLAPQQAQLRVLVIAMKGFGLDGQTLTGLIALNGIG